MFGVIVDGFLWEETFDTIEEAKENIENNYDANVIAEYEFIGICKITPLQQIVVPPRRAEWKTL